MLAFGSLGSLCSFGFVCEVLALGGGRVGWGGGGGSGGIREVGKLAMPLNEGLLLLVLGCIDLAE